MNSSLLARENLLRLLQGPGMERAAGAVNLLLVLFVAYLLAQLTWRLVPAPTLPQQQVRAQAAVGATASVTRAAPIASWHLFGEAASGSSPASPPINAPETHLNLVLHGVLSSTDVAIARAIIAAPGGNENDYAVGSELPGGAELTRIYSDRIILRRDGRYETLKLPKDMAQGVADNSGGTTDATADGSRSAGQLLLRYRKALKRNPGELFRLMRVQPVSENDRMVGFRVHPGGQPALLKELGLRNGDIVTAINGIELTSPSNGIRALEKLRAADSVNLTVQRGGRRIHLALNIP